MQLSANIVDKIIAPLGKPRILVVGDCNARSLLVW